MPELGARVVAGDAAVFVAEQRFPIFLCHARGTQPSPKGVLQIVSTDPGKATRTAVPPCFLQGDKSLPECPLLHTHVATPDVSVRGSCIERLLLCYFLVAQNEPLQFATRSLGQLFDELDFPWVRMCGQALSDMQAQDFSQLGAWQVLTV